MKEFSKLKFSDNYLFSRVLTKNKDIVKGIIELARNKIVKKIDVVNREWDIHPKMDMKSIRLDVLAKVNESVIYDIEMQNYRDVSLVKRMRYYLSTMDTDHLAKGKAYKHLPNCYVIMICNYDPFKLGKAIYVLNEEVKSDDKIVSDKCHYNSGYAKIIINTKANLDGIDDPKLKAFVHYFQTGIATDKFTKRIEESVQEIKNIDEEIKRYMTLQYYLEQVSKREIQKSVREGIKKGVEKELKKELRKERKKAHEEGKLEGRLEGRLEGKNEGIIEGRLEGVDETKKKAILGMFAKNISVDDIAEIMHISIEEVNEILLSNQTVS